MVATRNAPGVQGQDTAGVNNDWVLSVQGSNSGIPLISSISGTVDVSDRAARLLGIVDTELPAAIALSDVLGNPTVPGVGSYLLIWNGTNWVRVVGDTTNGQRVQQSPATLVQTGVSAANTAQTITLPSAGAGLFHYLDLIAIKRMSTAALVGAATANYTSTNLNGWAESFGNAMAAGDTKQDVYQQITGGLKSQVAATATTIVAPAAGAAVLTRVIVLYHVGP